MSGLKKLIHEMHRRSLWQVLGIYLGASWVVFEIVQTLTEGVGLPAWFPAFALGLLILGLPIVLATAFVQEGIGGQEGSDAEAVATTSPSLAAEATRQPTIGRRLLTWRNALLGGVGAFALWGVVAAGWLLAGGGPSRVGDGATAAADSIPSIAVLPFDNLSPEEENRYFADGMHDEILSQLAQIGTMRVTSRQSVLEFRESEQSIREIAAKLGVQYILEGSVGRAEGRVRIRAQLVHASEDRHLWSDTYERDLEQVFAIQADVARQIADALDARLTPEVSRRFETPPTADTEAYSLYLKGKVAYPDDAAEEHFRAAIALDPEFAAAHAWLAMILQYRYWWGDRDVELLERARESAERAIALAPDLPDAHVALGTVHYRALEFREAEPVLRRALELRRNDSHAWRELAHLLRRTGRFEQAADAYERSAAIDPRSASYEEIHWTYVWLRRAKDARRALALRSAVAEDSRSWPYEANVSLAVEGDTAVANAIWRNAGTPVDSLPLVEQFLWVENRRLQRDGPGLLAAIESFPDLWDYPAYVVVRSELEADAYRLMGNTPRARALLDSARAVVERGLRQRSDDSRYVGAHARILAALGESGAALAAGEWAVELTPLSRDALNGVFALADLAKVHALVGDPGRAIELLEQLLSVPSRVTPHVLRLDPAWDPLRDRPRFQRLIEQSQEGRPRTPCTFGGARRVTAVSPRLPVGGESPGPAPVVPASGGACTAVARGIR